MEEDFAGVLIPGIVDIGHAGRVEVAANEKETQSVGAAHFDTVGTEDVHHRWHPTLLCVVQFEKFDKLFRR